MWFLLLAVFQRSLLLLQLLLSRFSHVWLYVTPPASPVPGILQARTLKWVAISFSNAWKWKVKVKSLSCVQLFTTPWTADSSIRGILQARVLEWGAIACSVTISLYFSFLLLLFVYLYSYFLSINQWFSYFACFSKTQLFNLFISSFLFSTCLISDFKSWLLLTWLFSYLFELYV